MTKKITIRINDIIGSNLCIASEDGQKVFEKTVPLLQAGKHVVISFDGVSILISLFLNASIGQLYSKFSEQEIRTQLEVTGLAGDDMEILQRVVENAKRYYANPKEYDKAWAALECDDEE
ncbi:MAG: STAS-like domain-containing protein [Chlorobium sp.]